MWRCSKWQQYRIKAGDGKGDSIFRWKRTSLFNHYTISYIVKWLNFVYLSSKMDKMILKGSQSAERRSTIGRIRSYWGADKEATNFVQGGLNAGRLWFPLNFQHFLLWMRSIKVLNFGFFFVFGDSSPKARAADGLIGF